MDIKNIIQSSHLSFLIGSGASVPFFKSLGDIENLLTSINEIADHEQRELARFVVISNYFQECIYQNIDLLKNCDSKNVLDNYMNFFKIIYLIIIKRKSTIINKQINLFTTNMDIFQELALEKLSYDYNHGFSGSLNPKFGLSNFKKSILKTSQHYNVISELPVFNLYKLHGSVTWKNIKEEGIFLDTKLDQLSQVAKTHVKSSIELDSIVATEGKSKVDCILDKIKSEKITIDESVKTYLKEYDSMSIINPTKDKFKSTTLNYTYYELLRMFSNELERENNTLFVIGFSFADEHIREIVIRSLKTNPTLIIMVFAYDQQGEDDILKNFGFPSKESLPNNLTFISRENDSPEARHDLRKISDFFQHKLKEVLLKEK